MPSYCYRCLKCGYTTESPVRTSESVKLVCDCGTEMVRDYRAEAVGNTFTPTKGRGA